MPRDQVTSIQEVDPLGDAYVGTLSAAGTTVTSANNGYVADYDYACDTLVFSKSTGSAAVEIPVNTSNRYGRTNALTFTVASTARVYVPPGTLKPELFVQGGANAGRLHIDTDQDVFCLIVRGPRA